MSDSTFQSTNSTENEFAEAHNFELSDYLLLDANYTHGSTYDSELSEYLVSDEWVEGNSPTAMAALGSFHNSIPSIPKVVDSAQSKSQHGQQPTCSNNSSSSSKCEEGKNKKMVRDKVAFKTKSDVDIMDDGFRWRKYGKKMVKDSPNPRNYYRCSVDGCPVKKRVERDAEDSRYVITTYEGVHNHETPPL
ncbi:probable WRKY transcription factor 50 isoform X2 [Macadamia integrifolia]|uniref:probable WRKY transcription factor 50 isoform X2 n=1 Tax=Macadamia integrifolia TaxID=60698 RepID=UPI001C4F8745|nr:probable WRKY transcription factor 50 isoform X2 [Macadamia integrifolia]